VSNAINYTPPPTVKNFIKDFLPGGLFYNWIIGPVGSGKTTGLFFKLAYMAQLQAPSPVDGIRRSRAVVVRNTMPQLKDTTIVSWNMWFKDGVAGKWQATEKNFMLKFGDVECEVLFRALDTPDDIARVLSLEVTFAIIDEFVQVPREVIDALSGRVGRYPSKKDGGATNWGMWGSSNPGNEDDWWHDYLFGKRAATPKSVGSLLWADYMLSRGDAGGKSENEYVDNTFYYEQPSGFSPEAENLVNLPPYKEGDNSYYTNLADGKAKAWVRQYIETRWGYSNVGLPVLRSFNADIHVAKHSIKKFATPSRPLIVGFDPGMNAAAIIGQQNLDGRLLVFGELCTEGMGAVRFAREKLLPYLRGEFPQIPFIIVPDPAANSRTPTNEATVVGVLRGPPFHLNVDLVDMNNLLEPRIEAAEHYTARLVEGEPALLVDPSCKRLIRALSGGWRFTIMRKGDARSVEPEKNVWSHPADAFCYLCRYYYKGVIRELRNKRSGFKPPQRWTNPYDMR
jgi:hypothetical protein